MRIWLGGNRSKRARLEARAVITNNKSSSKFSSALGWELLAKSTKGQLGLGPGTPMDALRRHLAKLRGTLVLRIHMSHLYESYGLPNIHKDPIDRSLIGRSRTEDMTLISPDRNHSRTPSHSNAPSPGRIKVRGKSERISEQLFIYAAALGRFTNPTSGCFGEFSPDSELQSSTWSPRVIDSRSMCQRAVISARFGDLRNSARGLDAFTPRT